MKTGRRIIYWTVLTGLVLLTFWWGLARKTAEKAAVERVVPVEVEPVTTDSIEQTIELTGWVQANAIVDVKSKVQGRIESLEAVSDGGDSVAVEEGLRVRKGQQLAVIDHDVYLAQVAAAKAAVRAGELELEEAEREKNRILPLYEGGSATQQSRDKAVTAAQLADASLKLARANLELAEINLRESTIACPIDGIVTAKHIDEGNLIRAGDPIVTVADMKVVKIIVGVAERYGEQIAVGTAARIMIDTFGQKEFDAKVYSIHPALDPETHTILVEIRMQNDGLLLKPGMFGRVTLVMQRKADVVVVPRDVVLGGKIDRHYVYVVEQASARQIARKRFVEIGITRAEKCEVTEGLEAGQTLVVNGMDYLADGMPVEVVRIEDIK